MRVPEIRAEATYTYAQKPRFSVNELELQTYRLNVMN